jgi:hypothetical protein
VTISNRLSVLSVLLRSLLQSETEIWLLAVKQLTEKNVIFVSHLLNSSQYEQEDDFYFSDLPKSLRNNGYSSLVLMINHAGWTSAGGLAAQNHFKQSKLVFPRTLKFGEEIKNLKSLWLVYKRLKKESGIESNKIKKKVLLFAANEALSSSSLGSLRLAKQIKIVVKIANPKLLITTHEGHCWERMVYRATRLVKPNIKCVGYIHAPLFKHQHAVKRNLSEEYNPDMIFTSGDIQKRQLEKTGEILNIPIHVLGSVRSIKKKIKINPSLRNKLSKSKEAISCLIIPEGIASEVNKLFEFSLKCAKQFPGVLFVWRLHPLLSFETLSSKNNIYSSLPQNVILSKKTLIEDFDSCQWVLYRGSSAVIQAVVAGLKPIYLHIADEMKIDPLYEINSWKNEVETVQEFESITMQTTEGNNKYNEFDEAQKYCLEMYTPLNPQLLVNTLKISND